MAGWVYMVHPGAAGQRFPDDPDVIAAQQARGWELHSMPTALDPDALDTGEVVVQAAELYESQPILSDEEVEALRGKALDEALEAAGLSKTGTVAEKRERLAEHEAGLAGSTTTTESE